MLFQMRHTTVNLIQKINEYVENCKTEGVRHRVQAKHCMRWWNLLGILNVVFSASQALAMTVQVSFNDSNTSIAIVGGSFACLIAISNRIQMSFSFNCLSAEHHHLADNFLELEQRFLLLLNDIEKEEYSEEDYEKCIERYISITEKTHLQNVAKLELTCCKK